MIPKVDPEVFNLTTFELAASFFVDQKILKNINDREKLVEAQGYIKVYRKEFMKASILINQTEEYSLLSDVQKARMIAVTVQSSIKDNKNQDSVKYGR